MPQVANKLPAGIGVCACRRRAVILHVFAGRCACAPHCQSAVVGEEAHERAGAHAAGPAGLDADTGACTLISTTAINRRTWCWLHGEQLMLVYAAVAVAERAPGRFRAASVSCNGSRM